MVTSMASNDGISGHVFIATSIDGFIARRDGGIDWLEKYVVSGEDTGYGRFMDSVDGLVMGRGTFEKAMSFDAWPFSKPVVVMSSTLSELDLPAGLAGKVRISRLSPDQLLAVLASEGWRRVYVDGGQVIRSFLAMGLIADMVLTRVPVLLGDGISLFGAMVDQIALRHVGTVAFASGLVQSKYEICS